MRGLADGSPMGARPSASDDLLLARLAKRQRALSAVAGVLGQLRATEVAEGHASRRAAAGEREAKRDSERDAALRHAAASLARSYARTPAPLSDRQPPRPGRAEPRGPAPDSPETTSDCDLPVLRKERYAASAVA